MQKLDKFSLIFTGNMETTSIAKAIWRRDANSTFKP
jgi:hypothetical protein